MNGGTSLEIDLDKIQENAKKIMSICEPMKIEVLGVTKGFAALPQIVDAMIMGDIKNLADSHLENIISLRKKGYQNKMTLLRIPRLSVANKVAESVDYSANSEIDVIRKLSDSASKNNNKHKIILMIDVGDLREGVMPEDALKMAKQIIQLNGVSLVGVGTNMGCYGGVLPTIRNLRLLNDIAVDIEKQVGIKIEIVSGGGTSSLELVESGKMPQGINQLRIGEGILLGTDTTHDKAIPWLKQDAFLLKSEIIEVKTKPSMPIGRIGRDAFGNIPVFKNEGLRKRAIISLGKQDVSIDGLVPFDPVMKVLGASSDHLIVDVNDTEREIKVGDQITFKLNYQGLLLLSNSKYVRKVYRRSKT